MSDLKKPFSRLLNFFSSLKKELSEDEVHFLEQLHQERHWLDVHFTEYNHKKTWSLRKSDIWHSGYHEWKKLEHKRSKLIEDLEKREQLGADLQEQLLACSSIAQFDDLARPLKRKRKTKGALAREAGLMPLAEVVLGEKALPEDFESAEVEAKKYLNPSLGFVTYEAVLKGVQDIVVEQVLVQHQSLRKETLDCVLETGLLKVEKGDRFVETDAKQQNFLSYKDTVKSLLVEKNMSRFPSLKKAWEESRVKVFIKSELDDIRKKFENVFCESKPKEFQVFLKTSATKALDIHVYASVVHEVFDRLIERASKHSMYQIKEDVFSLLMSPSLGQKAVLAIDPREKGPSLLGLINDAGEVISYTLLPDPLDSGLSEEEKIKTVCDILKTVFENLEVGAIGIGLDKGSRPIETLIRKCLAEMKQSIPIVMVDGRGLSLYAASELADEELSDLKPHERRVISLARRVQSPLHELSKIPLSSLVEVPKLINKEQLEFELNKELQKAIALVGIDIQKDSLHFIKGLEFLDSELLEAFKQERDKTPFVEKRQLNNISGISKETAIAFSRFCKIKKAPKAFDQTKLPLSFQAPLQDFFKDKDLQMDAMSLDDLKAFQKASELKAFFKDHEIELVSRELKSFGKDVRRPYRVFNFSPEVSTLTDLKVGWNYPGLVVKMASYGVFVDIGVGQEGLVHLSELSNEYTPDPRRAVKLNDWIRVKVIAVDLNKNQLSLSKVKAETSGERSSDKRPQRSEGRKSFDSKNQNRPGKDKRAFSKNSSKEGSSRSGNRNQANSNRNSPNKNRSNQGRPYRKPATPFNNPFAALSAVEAPKQDKKTN